MAQADGVISNASGAAVRADLNNQLAALFTNHSGATEPATTYAYQMWADTGSTPAVMKLRDSTNSSWITLYNLDGSSLPIASATEIVFNDAGADLDFRIEGDTDANLFYVDAGNDRIGIGTASPATTLNLGDSGVLRINNPNGTRNLELFNDSTHAEIKSSVDPIRINAEHSSGYVRFDTNTTERARIEADGDILLGDTSNHTFIRPYEATTGNVIIGVDQGATGTGGSSILFNTRGTERVRITNDTRMGIGTSSPSKTLDVSGVITTSHGYTYKAASSASDTYLGTFAPGGSAMAFATLGLERMRIYSDGNVYIGASSTISGLGLQVYSTSNNSALGTAYFKNDNTSATHPAAAFVTATNSTATSNVLVRFGINSYSSGSGQINANGSGQAAFGFFSDERLKENIVDLPSQWENIKNLRPVEFDFIESQGGEHQIGFIAQEFETVYPDAVGSQPMFIGVDEETSEERLTLTGWSKTDARLVKALQEAIAKIETLEAKVAALESA